MEHHRRAFSRHFPLTINPYYETEREPETYEAASTRSLFMGPVGLTIRRGKSLNLADLLHLDVAVGLGLLRWRRGGQQFYSSDGYAVSFAYHDTIRILKRRMILDVFLLPKSSNILGYSIQYEVRSATYIPREHADFMAVETGDLSYIQTKIELEALDVNGATWDGYSLLHCAADYGQVDILAVLIANGADKNVTDYRGNTLLHTSVKDGRHPECARYLLELGADPGKPDISGCTALHNFYNSVWELIFQSCIRKIDVWAQDNSGMTVFHYLAWSKSSRPEDLLRCLVEVCLLPHRSFSGTSSPLFIKDNEGKSILHYAVERGNLRFTLAIFVSYSRSWEILSMPDHMGRTLLHYATESSGAGDMIDFLREKGFDEAAIDLQGHSIMHHACRRDGLKAVQYLVSLGLAGQLEQLDHAGKTPVDWAQQCHARQVMEYLTDLRPDLVARAQRSCIDINSALLHA